MDTRIAVQYVDVAPGRVATQPGPTPCKGPDCRVVIERPAVKKRNALGEPVEVQKFCSNACRVREYSLHHPRINPPGLLVGTADDGKSIKQRIRELLADGLQRTTGGIAAELCISEATAARELRKLRHDLGAPVRMARLKGHRKPAVFWLPKAAA